jgi:hypothetical protein
MNRNERRAREAAMLKIAREDARYLESKLERGTTQIRIGRCQDDSMILALTTPKGHYEWPLSMAHNLVAGLRECADGEHVPAVSDRHIWGVGIAMYVAISDARLPDVKPLNGAEVTLVTAPPAYVMRPQSARDMADTIEDALAELGPEAPKP